MTTLRSVLMFCSLVWMVGCASPVKELEELAKEGTAPGDCRDGADSDDDGLFDCDDPGCRGSPDCDGEADADSDADADADADEDPDPVEEELTVTVEYPPAEKKGCATASGTPGWVWTVGLLAVLGLRRREE